MQIATFFGESSRPQYCCLPKGREFQRVQLYCYLQCEPELPSCLNRLVKSLCSGVGFHMYLSGGAQRSSVPSLPSSLPPGSRSRDSLWVYTGKGGLGAQAESYLSHQDSQNSQPQFQVLMSLWSLYRVKINTSWSALLMPQGWAWHRDPVWEEFSTPNEKNLVTTWFISPSSMLLLF